MSDITRAEFDALVQKVKEIHQMLKSHMGLLPAYPYSTPQFVSGPRETIPLTIPPYGMQEITARNTGDTNGQ